MQKPELKTIWGIVIPAVWNEIGDVVSVAIADYGEEKYLVTDNEAGRKLLSLLRKRVVVDGDGGPQKLDSVLSSDSDHSWRI